MPEKTTAHPADKAATASNSTRPKSVAEHIIPSLAAARKITKNLNVAFAKTKR